MMYRCLDVKSKQCLKIAKAYIFDDFVFDDVCSKIDIDEDMFDEHC